jgi:uncharacterized membrane protein YhhN
MGRDAHYATLALLGVGPVLLLAAAAVLFTGNWHLVGYAVPVTLVGFAVVGLGVHRLDRWVERASGA